MKGSYFSLLCELEVGVVIPTFCPRPSLESQGEGFNW